VSLSVFRPWPARPLTRPLNRRPRVGSSKRLCSYRGGGKKEEEEKEEEASFIQPHTNKSIQSVLIPQLSANLYFSLGSNSRRIPETRHCFRSTYTGRGEEEEVSGEETRLTQKVQFGTLVSEQKGYLARCSEITNRLCCNGDMFIPEYKS
jgi:hypothetical protein